MGKARPSLGQQVHSWARSRVGQRVGTGECFDLADRALRDAGARTAEDYGAVTPDADYQWGDSIALAQVQAGDVLQFRNSSVTVRVVVTRVRTFRDGSTEESEEETYQTYERPHHTAIVSGRSGSGRLQVLEQNVPSPGATAPERVVRQHELHTASSTTTESRAYQEGGGTVRETRTTTITVSGTIRAYRPRPK